MRVKRPFFLLRDYVTPLNPMPSPSPSSPSPPGTSSTLYPMTHFVFVDKFSERHHILLVVVTTGHEPLSFKEAMIDVGGVKPCKRRSLSWRLMILGF